MRVHRKQRSLFGIKWSVRTSDERGTWATIAVGVVTTGVGMYTANKTNKENERRANESKADFEARMKGAQGQMDAAVASLNAMRAERPGTTFNDWKNVYVQGITDPVLRDNFRKIKEEDFEAASGFAQKATLGNVMNFLGSRELISGGKAVPLQAQAQDIALSSDTPAAMARAMELRAKYIPSGTVKYDQQGRLIEGQRGDRQIFTAAYEEDAKNRDIQFRRARDLVNDYSTMADRQTEKSRDFLQFAGLEPVAREFAMKAMQTDIDFQKMDEQGQLDLIKMYAQGMMGMQPGTPQFQSTAASDKMTQEGISTAVKGIAQYYGGSSSGGGMNFGSGTKSYEYGSPQYAGTEQAPWLEA